LVTIGYTHSMFPATVAVIGAIFVNEWWLALACGAVSIICWLMVRDYLGPPPVGTSQAR